MSELQIALIGIGALIIITVLFINWWQERRFHKQVEKGFSQLQRDALLDEDALNEPANYDSNLDVPTLNKPAFTNNEFYVNTDTVLDDSASDRFTISETTINPQGKSAYYDSSDRFVPLPIENAAEVLAKQDASIEDTYNELINTKINSKLDKNPNQNFGSDSVVNRQTDNQEYSDIAETKATLDENQVDECQTPNNQTFNNQTFNEQITAPIEAEATVSLPEMLHGQIDLTALLYLSKETPINTLIKALASLFDNFDKPIFVHVLDSNKHWHLLKDLQSNPDALNRLISKVACSIQLADRGGAIDRSSLNRFQLAVETFGLDVNGHVEWQNAGDALSAASSLDLFCIEVDQTIGFHLIHGESGAFTGTKLRGLAEAQGLLLDSDGTFKLFEQATDDASEAKTNSAKPQVHPSFIMFNRDDHPFSPEMLRTSVVKSVTFQLDIPHVKQSAETFTHMVQVARQMEKGLNAILVDDKNRVLGDIQIEKIRQQLKVLQASMLVRGIVPGSDYAHRLFS